MSSPSGSNQLEILDTKHKKHIRLDNTPRYSIDDLSIAKKFKSVPSIFMCMKHSRHQRLFLCGKLGIHLLRTFIKCLYLIVLLWFTYLINNKYVDDGMLAQNMVLGNSSIDLVVTWSSILSTLWITFYYYPSVIHQYVVVTNIEMMKNKKLIHKVILEQRQSKLFFASYHSKLQIYLFNHLQFVTYCFE